MRVVWTVASLLLFTNVASANVEVTCLDGDCLTSGWEVVDHFKRESSTVMCRNANCNVDGWTGVFKEATQSETMCKGGDCFKFGWLVYDGRTGNLAVDVTCRADFTGTRDCLRFGWDIQDYFTRQTQAVYCVNNDCYNIGWDLFAPGYPIIATRCKFGGCFRAGWITYR